MRGDVAKAEAATKEEAEIRDAYCEEGCLPSKLADVVVVFKYSYLTASRIPPGLDIEQLDKGRGKMGPL